MHIASIEATCRANRATITAVIAAYALDFSGGLPVHGLKHKRRNAATGGSHQGPRPCRSNRRGCCTSALEY